MGGPSHHPHHLPHHHPISGPRPPSHHPIRPPSHPALCGFLHHHYPARLCGLRSPNPPPPIQRSFGAASTVPPYGWSLAPSPPSTIPPPNQWSWGPFLPSASTAPSRVWPPASSAPHLVGPRAAAPTRPMGPPVAAATRYPHLLVGGAGYHFTDYSTLRALILANPPPIMRSANPPPFMRSDGAASKHMGGRGPQWHPAPWVLCHHQHRALWVLRRQRQHVILTCLPEELDTTHLLL